MSIIKHSMILLTLGLMIILIGLGQKEIGIFAFLLVYALCINDKKRFKDQGLNQVDKMDGFEFERYTADLLQRQGFKTQVTQEKGDFGADVIATKGGIKYVVQCKRYKDHVGIDAVYQILGGKEYYKAHKAMVVTNSTYTEAARKLAHRAGVIMIDREELKKMIVNASNC